MQNYHAIETDVAHRRCEWERAIAAATQVAQAGPEHGLRRWSDLPRLALAHLRSLAAPRLPLSSWTAAVAGSSTKRLEDVVPR